MHWKVHIVTNCLKGTYFSGNTCKERPLIPLQGKGGKARKTYNKRPDPIGFSYVICWIARPGPKGFSLFTW